MLGASGSELPGVRAIQYLEEVQNVLAGAITLGARTAEVCLQKERMACGRGEE